MIYTWNKGIQIYKTNIGHPVCKIYASNTNSLPQVISRLKQKTITSLLLKKILYNINSQYLNLSLVNITWNCFNSIIAKETR